MEDALEFNSDIAKIFESRGKVREEQKFSEESIKFLRNKYRWIGENNMLLESLLESCYKEYYENKEFLKTPLSFFGFKPVESGLSKSND